MDKLKFWKKEEIQGPNLGLQGMEPGFEQDQGFDDTGFEGLDQPMYGYPAQPQQSPYPTTSKYPRSQPMQEYEPPETRSFDHTKQPFQYPQPGAAQDVSPQQYAIDKNLEVISSKLDALRAAIESVNQRLANVERMVQEQRRRGW